MKIILGNKIRVKYNPLLYFLIFIFLNILLTYGSLSLQPKFWTLFSGFFVLLFALSASPPVPFGAKPPYALEAFTGPPIWLWILLTALLMLVRFWRLGILDAWPGGDKTLMALYAVEWLQRWDWKLFVTLGQDPSTLSYFCWLVLKAFNSPVLAIQLPPI